MYLRTWVAEVTIATANGELIRRYKALSGAFQRIRAARATVKKFAIGTRFMLTSFPRALVMQWCPYPGSPYSDAQKLQAAETQLKALEIRMDEINRKYRTAWRPDCVGAFVVFNCEEVRGVIINVPLNSVSDLFFC